MKKKFIVLLILLFGSSVLFAQVGKGNWFLAGYSNFGLDIGKNKSKYDGTTSENYKYSDFFFAPQAGYFVIDNLTAGLFLDFDRYTQIDDGDKEFDTKFIIGPFIRYYILDYKGLRPYAEGRFGVGSEKYTNNYESAYEEKYSYFSTRLGAGATYFITKHFGLDLFMGYDYDVWSYKEDNSSSRQMSSDDESKDKYSSFEMNIGAVVTFGK